MTAGRLRRHPDPVVDAQVTRISMAFDYWVYLAALRSSRYRACKALPI